MPKVILKIEIDELARDDLLDLAKRLQRDPSDLVRTLVYARRHQLRQALAAKPAAKIITAQAATSKLRKHFTRTTEFKGSVFYSDAVLGNIQTINL